jgi:hypothetical protein
MNKVEAKKILAEQLQRYRAMIYLQLLELMTDPQSTEVMADSGVKYGLEFEVVLDTEPGRDLRVIGSIDDGGWRSFSPISDSFIMREDGSFVGE